MEYWLIIAGEAVNTPQLLGLADLGLSSRCRLRTAFAAILTSVLMPVVHTYPKMDLRMFNIV